MGLDRSRAVEGGSTAAARAAPGTGAAAEAVLLIGPVLAFVASLLLQTGDTTEATLEWVREHERQAEISKALDLLAMPFFFAGIAVYWLQTSGRSLKLAWLAAISLTAGYVGLTAVHGSQIIAFELAGDLNVNITSIATALDSDPLPLVVEQVLVFGGWVLGMVGVLFAFTRSSAVPSTAAFFFFNLPFAVVFAPEEISAFLWLGTAFAVGGLFWLNRQSMRRGFA
jgi:hypothetical protein